MSTEEQEKGHLNYSVTMIKAQKYKIVSDDNNNFIWMMLYGFTQPPSTNKT